MTEDTDALAPDDTAADDDQFVDWHGRTSDDFDEDCGDNRYAEYLAGMRGYLNQTKPRRNYDYVNRD